MHNRGFVHNVHGNKYIVKVRPKQNFCITIPSTAKLHLAKAFFYCIFIFNICVVIEPKVLQHANISPL